MTNRPPATPRIAHLVPPYGPAVAAALATVHPAGLPNEPLKFARTVLKNGPLAGAMAGLGRFMMSRDGEAAPHFDVRTRELVIGRVTARCGCEYEWGVHAAAQGKAAGFSDDQLYSMVRGSGADSCWSEEDRVTLEFVDQLHDSGAVSDEIWSSLGRRFDEATLLELMALAGWYHVVSFMANGARTELEPWAPRFPDKR